MSSFSNLQKEYDLLSEKIHRLQMALIIETDEAVRFKLEKQIEEAQIRCHQIEQQLEGVEKLSLTCPYRGLFAFREQDAPFFFGRETFTEQLIEAAQKKSLIAVIGPSGSGKSSVVFAGLLPHLRQFHSWGGQGHSPPERGKEGVPMEWGIVHFRPGSDPFRALAAALIPFLEPQMSTTDSLIETRKLMEALRQGNLSLREVAEQVLRERQNANHLLLFTDQFEELYTLCTEQEDRRQFLDELLGVIGVQTLVCCLTLRADFMEQALAYRPLADTLQDNMLNLGPMMREELQRAINRPAEQLNIAFEAGLVERILDDIENEPGSLPLLEFALTLLWERQAFGKLTHEAYETIGQVKGALARHADEIYADLNKNEQQQLRRVLVQLVRPGEGTEDTRRLASRKELGDKQWTLVRRMADTRLVVTDRDPTGEETVEVVHESLIWGWGRLREWMNENRDFRTWQEWLRTILHQWKASGREKGVLLRGTLLAEAKRWLTKRKSDLSQAEQEFIRVSMDWKRKRLLYQLAAVIGSVVGGFVLPITLIYLIGPIGADPLTEARNQYEFALWSDNPLPRYKAALKELDTAIAQDESQWQAYVIKGLIYRNLNEFDLAKKNLEIVKQRNYEEWLQWIPDIINLIYGEIFHRQATEALRSGSLENAKNYQEMAFQFFDDVIINTSNKQEEVSPYFLDVSVQDLYIEALERWAAGKFQMAEIVETLEGREQQDELLKEVVTRLSGVVETYPDATTNLRYYLANGYYKQALIIKNNPKESKKLQNQALAQLLQVCEELGFSINLRRAGTQLIRTFSKAREIDLEMKILRTIPSQ